MILPSEGTEQKYSFEVDSLLSYMAVEGGAIDADEYGHEQNSVPRQISHYLGRACVRAAQGDKRRAKRRVRDARNLVRNNEGAPRLQRFQLELMDIYGDFVQFANQSTEKIKQVRSEYQKQALDQLIESQRRVLNNNPSSMRERSVRNDWLGHMNELTVLTVLNRGQPDDVLVLPALPHHNASRSPGNNYDLLALVGSDKENGCLATKVQVKSTPTGKGSLKKYDPSIFTLYASDYFGNEHSWMTPDRKERFPVTQCIIREYAGTATAGDMATLETVRNDLLRDIRQHEADQFQCTGSRTVIA